jgi:hypothetical protein
MTNYFVQYSRHEFRTQKRQRYARGINGDTQAPGWVIALGILQYSNVDYLSNFLFLLPL